MKSTLQTITLPCPVLNGVDRHGWLEIQWHEDDLATVQWDYGEFDHCYPQCDRFKYLLEQAAWDCELGLRLVDFGWKWQHMGRLEMRWCLLNRDVPSEVAQWILDTLPGVYQTASDQYHAAYGRRRVRFSSEHEADCRAWLAANPYERP